MNKWKWLLRIASMLIVLGFFMPAVLVSCNSGVTNLIGIDAREAMSLMDVANLAEQPILYLIPFLSIVAIILSLLQNEKNSQAIGFLWGQLAIIIVQLLILVGTIVSLKNTIQTYTLDTVEVTPTFGTFVIVGAGILYLVTWFFQKSLVGSSAPVYQTPAVIQEYPPGEYLPQTPQQPVYQPIQEENFGWDQIPAPQAHLVVLSGNHHARQIQIPSDNFSVGRSSMNQLHLEDPSVSRRHAVFRYSQNAWFLQDQESSGGTFVNGNRIDAVKLKDGDEIGIGPVIFQFRSN